MDNQLFNSSRTVPSMEIKAAKVVLRFAWKKKKKGILYDFVEVSEKDKYGTICKEMLIDVVEVMREASLKPASLCGLVP